MALEGCSLPRPETALSELGFNPGGGIVPMTRGPQE